MIRRGAPFDPDNFFNIPPVDAGDINPLYDTVIANIDGEGFTATPQNYFDGGYIPLKGTATYDPKIEYGPWSPLLEDDA
jgi:hypothetical protein